MLEDKLLIKQLKRGDRDALRKLYEKYKDDMLSIACSMLHDPSVAEDILHDVFVSFVTDVMQYQPYGSLKSYFITCVANRVRDRFRSIKNEPVDMNSIEPRGSDSEKPDKLMMESEESQRLTDALACLPFWYREIIVLHVQGNMKFREIANLQGISINTVQSRYRHGLSKLRSLLNSEVENETN